MQIVVSVVVSKPFKCSLLFIWVSSGGIGCSPVHLLHTFTTPFSKNTSGWLLLEVRTAIAN